MLYLYKSKISLEVNHHLTIVLSFKLYDTNILTYFSSSSQLMDGGMHKHMDIQTHMYNKNFFISF